MSTLESFVSSYHRLLLNRYNNSFVITATAPDQYLYGRLSLLASSAGEKMSNLPSVLPSGKTDEDVDDDWELSDEEELNNSDHLRDDGDNVFMHSDDEADEDEGFANTGTPIVEGRRIPIGPPQDCDVKPVKRVPPQVMLARAENTLHRLTFGLSMDKLFHTSLAVGKRLSFSGYKTSQESLTEEMDEANNGRRRRKRSLLDDFDKRLGLRTRSKNPVVGITSSFLGPIMRMFRIFLVATRVVFNIGVWKDPFLSFWVLCFLVALMLILLIFPWRSFMFLAGLVCFGPQVGRLQQSFSLFRRILMNYHIFTVLRTSLCEGGLFAVLLPQKKSANKLENELKVPLTMMRLPLALLKMMLLPYTPSRLQMAPQATDQRVLRPMQQHQKMTMVMVRR